MSGRSAIEWTDATWGPVTGCTKVSQGCKNCFADREWPRFAAHRNSRFSGRAFTDVQEHMDLIDWPLRQRAPRKIFVNPRGDLFHEHVSRTFTDYVLAVMAMCPQHTFQILTKRPKRALEDLTSPFLGTDMRGPIWFEKRYRKRLGVPIDRNPTQEEWDEIRARITWPLPNVWVGVSVEDQTTADERIPLLLQTPAAVRFISAEPLLGPIDLRNLTVPRRYGSALLDCLTCDLKTHHQEVFAGPPAGVGPLDWVITGGESGPKARPMHPDWPRSLRDQCKAVGVPFLFKQWGEWIPGETEVLSEPPGRAVYPDDETIELVDGRRYATTKAHGREFIKVGKRTAGRLLDGREHSEFPA